MEKQEEYEIRINLYNKLTSEIQVALDKYYEKYKDNFYYLILLPQLLVEEKFVKLSNLSVTANLDAGELLVLGNPLRFATYWFVKEMLSRKKISRYSYEKINLDEDFNSRLEDFILSTYDNYKKAHQLKLMRSYSKVKIERKLDNSASLSIFFPKVDNKYNKEMLYYYGLDDSLRMEKERNIISDCELYMFSKFDIKSIFINPKSLNIYFNILDSMQSVPDIKFYELCKKRVSIDINKIADRISSDIIQDKNELISIIAMFYYLCRICSVRDMLKDGTYKENVKHHCCFDKSVIYALGQKLGIKKETIIRYIGYLSMDVSVKGGSFNEFPLVSLKEKIMWIPSSFVLNDFQFSIVNAHYYKTISFKEKDETVSKSIVDYIENEGNKYTNILVEKNYIYHDLLNKFNNKDLQSDIDIALYDTIHNVLMIIECKWKENVYADKDEYVIIEDAIKKIYDRQLAKHEFYINLNIENINKLFKHKVDFNVKAENMRLSYLFVDKRIQFHKNNRHAVPIFMLAYLFNEYSDATTLYLNKVLDDIEKQESRVEHEETNLKPILLLKEIVR